MPPRLPDCVASSPAPPAAPGPSPAAAARAPALARRPATSTPSSTPACRGRSRFRHLLAYDSGEVAVAGQALARQRKVAARHTATLLQLALIAQHRRELVAAVAEGRPSTACRDPGAPGLPPAPLVDLPDLNTKPLMRYLDRVKERCHLERARRAGELDSTHPTVLRAQLLAESIEAALGPAFGALEATLTSLPAGLPRLAGEPALDALLDLPAAPATNNQSSNQPPSAATDSAEVPSTPAVKLVAPHADIDEQSSRPCTGGTSAPYQGTAALLPTPTTGSRVPTRGARPSSEPVIARYLPWKLRPPDGC